MREEMDRWDMFDDIVKMCHRYDGVIFGGAVRDSYLHKIHERSGTLTEDQVVPHDVDCFIKANQLPQLISTLQRKYYIKDYPSSSFYMELPHGYRLRQYSVLELTEGDPTIFGLDLLIQDEGDLMVPTLPFDMDVNLLMWDKYKVFVVPTARTVLQELFGAIWKTSDSHSMDDLLNLNTILDHIVAKQAVCMSTCEGTRIRKMKRYGWNLQYSYETITISEDVYDGVCVLCQDTMAGPHSAFLCGCARICMSCLRIHHSSLSKCTICKQTVDLRKLENDVRIYTYLHDT